MIFNKDDKRNFEEAAVCHICNRPFEAGEEKVRDHCHLIGKFRGAAHNRCNLNYKDPKFFPVIFHNLSGYDSHLFIKQIGNNNNNNNNIRLISQDKPLDHNR